MNGLPNAVKIVSIANRLRMAPESMHQEVTNELIQAVFEENPEPNPPEPGRQRMQCFCSLGMEDLRSRFKASSNAEEINDLTEAMYVEGLRQRLRDEKDPARARSLYEEIQRNK